MKIATHNSEKLLLADLREAKIGSPTHRCLLLRFSEINATMSVWLPRLDRSIRHNLGDTIEQIYLTHDQDIFIYGWGLTHTNVSKLIADLSEVIDPERVNSLVSLYEIGIHWDRLESLYPKNP